MTPRARRGARAAAVRGAVAAHGTAVIGVAHTPWGRPLLRLPGLSALARHAGCPVGPIGPAAYEKVRTTKLQSEAGAGVAHSRPALAFVLGAARRAEVESWLKSRGVECQTGFVASVLECDHVPQTPALAIAHVRFQFDGNQHLVGVDLFREPSEPAPLVDTFVSTAARLDEQVGPATSQTGTPSVAFATGGPFRTVQRLYRYQDYVAQLTLLNLGKRGLRLREQYGFLPPPA